MARSASALAIPQSLPPEVMHSNDRAVGTPKHDSAKVRDEAARAAVLPGPWDRREPDRLKPGNLPLLDEPLPDSNVLRQDAPARPLDWRWLRGLWLLEHGAKPTRNRDDEFMVGITQFQACLQRCRTDGDVVRLTDWRPNFFGAYEVRVDSPELFKASLEARILARQPVIDIAKRLCMRAGAVESYERLFYNIEDRLDAIDWINLRVLGNTKNGTAEHEDRGALLRLFGYHFGPVAVDELVADFSAATPRPGDLSEVPAAFDDDIRRTLARKAAIAARMLRIDDPKIAIRVLKMQLRWKYMEMRMKRIHRNDISVGLEPNIQAMEDGLAAAFESVRQTEALCRMRVPGARAAAQGADAQAGDDARVTEPEMVEQALFQVD